LAHNEDEKNTDWLGDAELINDIGRLRQIVKDLTDLQLSPGKIYLDKYLRHQYHGIMAGIAGSPLNRLDDALSQEYNKGRAFENIQHEFIVPNLIAMFKERIDGLKLIQSYEDSENEE
jgi:hypothetical protein